MENTFDVLMETYAESFGQEAADQFRKVLRCRHRSIDVTTELPDAQTPMLDRGALFLARTEGVAGELTDRGVEALSKCDREVAHRSDDVLAWASTIALKYTHPLWSRAASVYWPQCSVFSHFR